MRVRGIFTATTISPSSWPRQCPDRCTIRAGRNLPDKEFRYLRTVIVTAAVYWGFNSELAPLLLTFQHRAGVRPYTASFDLAKPCVFVKQSPGPFLCGLPYRRRPFSRSYRTNLPSSLATNHSSTLGFSPRLPVSVYGTGLLCLCLEGFLGGSYLHFPRSRSLVVLSGSAQLADLPTSLITYSLQRTIPSVRGSFTPASPHRSTTKYRNINRFAIDFPFRVRLRSRLTLF